jgi:tetratricopeptide (TPR) repeat protein
VLNRDHARKAADYARRAAAQAQAQLAWEDAIRHYDRCLDLIAAHDDRLGQDEATLWLERGLSIVGDGREAGPGFERAFALWPDHDPLGLARCALRVLAALAVPPAVRRHAPTIDRVLAALDHAPIPEVCALLAWKATAFHGQEGDDAARRADAMAAALGLRGPQYPLLLRVRTPRGALDEGRLTEAAQGFEELMRELDSLNQQQALNVPLVNLIFTAWMMGDFQRTEALLGRALEALRERGYRGESFNGWLALARGRRGVAEATASLLLSLSGKYISPGVDLAAADIALASGARNEAIERLPDPATARMEFIRANRLGERCRVLALSGRRTEAEATFREWESLFSRAYDPDLIEFIYHVESLDDVLCDFGDEPLLRRILDRLAPVTELHNWWNGSGPDYLRGAIELRLGDPDAAERWFATGLEWATGEGVPLVAGRCHQGLAEVAERRGDASAASQHLDAAGELFARIGARLYLEQVIAKKGVLKA